MVGAHGVWRRALLALVLLGAAGCASGVRPDGEWYRHPERRWQIAGPTGGWHRVAVDGADLAFRGEGGATMSLATRCNVSLADPPTLARHLRFGLQGEQLVSSGPVEVDGSEGWMQVFEVPGEVRIKTITLVADPCIYDWVLAARTGFARAEPEFDAWWSSFQRLDGPGA